MPISSKITAADLFSVYLAKNQLVRFQNVDKGSWVVSKYQGLRLVDDEIDYGAHERFETCSHGKFKTFFNTYWWCEQNGTMSDESETIEDWNEFKVQLFPNHKIALISFHKTYLSANGPYLICKAIQQLSNKELFNVYL